HLHHWNTPPLTGDGAPAASRVPSALLSDELFSAKLESVLQEGLRRTGTRPVSFRMGRWDLHARHWPLLARAGILTDASVRPLHAGSAENLAPDHFLAPQNTPYLVETGEGAVFEVPLTVTHLSPLLSRLVRLSGSRRLISSLQNWGVLALLPVYHPLWAMQAVTSLSAARGNTVISLTWHSSEMMPGGNPRMPDRPSIDAFMAKCGAYVAWLKKNFTVTFATMDELRRMEAASSPVMRSADADWAVPEGR
ncbi:MAG: glycosyl transferase family 1, partial [Desulfovibrionaceae bacterium]|nr:glycosyl transferase family 1 [Desulfovibrionaceae bacterium]